jgi:hypothetical protein
MKLHTFDNVVNGTRYRGFTRNQNGSHLKRHMRLGDVVLDPYGWKYVKPMRVTKGRTLIADQILERVALEGFAVTQMPPLPTKFFVFEMSLDSADIKIYSGDRTLAAFKDCLHRARLGPKPNLILGEKEHFLGEVEIRSREEAQRMGLSDYDKLLRRGFLVEVIRVASQEECIEKEMLRFLNSESKKRNWGVGFTDIKINMKKSEMPSTVPNEITTSPPTAQSKTPQSLNGGISSETSTDSQQSPIHAGLSILKNTLLAISFIGVLMIISGIVFVVLGSTGNTEINLFGNSFKSQNVGIAGLFCGLMLVIVGLRQMLTTLERVLQRHGKDTEKKL